MRAQLPPPADKSSAASAEDGWSARGFILFGLACVALLAGGLGTWAATASLSGAVIASGQMRVESNRQVVQHPDGGVVGEILVQDGDIVAGGDVLLRLDDTLLRSELAAMESQLYEIMARRGRLEAEQIGADRIEFDPEVLEEAAGNPGVARLVQGQRALFVARRESTAKEMAALEEQKLQLSDQITGAEAQLASLRRQSELIAKELVGQQSLLAKGLAQASRVLALEREAARLEGQAGELMAQVAQFRGQIAEIDIMQLQKTAQLREDAITELREIGFRELELEQKRLSLRERLSRLEIRAPRAGVVLDMAVHALKSVVRPAEPILYVVPTDTALVVDARIEPMNVDQVWQGQDAVLRFSAFNARTTPEIFGKVVRVSPDVITDEATKQVFYRAEVALKTGELAKLEGQELVPGMPVEVFIQTGERTPLNYMLKPITDYFNRAMREQ
ncbi:MAG TPA: HlyD family type I secretion periplasmic adaptor subunit [Paracoccaceae bacterium]|nr:HlyD family type I secretion periplasmic adaptor subunit [Paracoccaceae bacterium]